MNDEIVGKRFGKLVVERFDHFYIAPCNGKRQKRWFCRCDCGNSTITSKNKLTSGHTKSCGCSKSEAISRSRSTHRGTVDNPGEYRVWSLIKQRTSNPNNPHYHDYGGRGITLCERWLNSFENFLEDMGERPENGYTIERKDVNEGYNPDNCVWTNDKSLQSFNKKVFKSNKSGRTGVRRIILTSGEEVWVTQITKGSIRKRSTELSFEDAVKKVEEWEFELYGFIRK